MDDRKRGAAARNLDGEQDVRFEKVRRTVKGVCENVGLALGTLA